jgi:tetratricopeptide (TPR) repeat protein
VTGDLAAARAAQERALAIWDQTLGPGHPRVADGLNNLAALLEVTGDVRAARALHERALAITEQTLGPAHPDVATSLNNLAAVLLATGDTAGARPLLERSQRVWEATLGPASPGTALGLNNLAGLLVRTGDLAAARPLYERALTIYERALGPGHPDVATTASNLAPLLAAAGDLAAAQDLQERAVAIWERALGPDHPDVAIGLFALAGLARQGGDPGRARTLGERARRIFVTAGRASLDLDEDAHRGLLQAGHRGLRAHVALLAGIARDRDLDREATPAADDAFVAVEQLRAGSVQAALARAGARAASGDPASAALARESQELRDRRGTLRGLLALEYGRAGGADRDRRVEALRREARDVERRLEGANTRLLAAFPAYRALVAPDPLGPAAAAAAAALLREGEALASFFTLDDRLLAWLVRPGRPAAYRDVPVRRADLAALVRRVRTSLDRPGKPVDVAGAHELFRLLLEPWRDALAGVEHLVIVPDEVLLPVPFAALVTRPGGDAHGRLDDLYRRQVAPGPGDERRYAQLAWLAREVAISVLPTATSMRALRPVRRAAGADPEPFLGFGDPLLTGTGGGRGGAMLPARDGTVSVEEVRKLPRLPATRHEIRALARMLGSSFLPATPRRLTGRGKAWRAWPAPSSSPGRRPCSSPTGAWMTGPPRPS